MVSRDRFAGLWDPKDVLDSLWRIFASPYTTMLLLAGMAVLVCLGIGLPQRPRETIADPTANSLWLVSLRDRYHGIADWLVRLKLVDIHHSLWLRGLFGLLGFNLLLGMVDLLRPRHALLGAPAIRILSGTLPSAGSSEQPLQYVKQVLRARHYRVAAGSNGELAYADRFVLFPVLLYLGILILIAGLVLSERTAWWEEGFALRPGQVRPVGHATALALRAQVLTRNEDRGQGHNEWTELTFLREEREVARAILRDHAPSLYAALFFYSVSTEPALLVTASDHTGRNLGLRAPETGTTEFRELTLRFREDEGPRYIVTLGLTPGPQLGRQFQRKGNEQYVLVPSRDLTLRLLYYPSEPGGARPSFQLEAFRGAETQPFYQGHFESISAVEIAGDRYTFEPQRYAVIKFGQDYGLALIFIGAALTLAGIALSVWHPPQRLWLMAQTRDGDVDLRFITGISVEGRASQWFEDIVHDVAVVLALTAQGEPLPEPVWPR